MAAAKKDAVEVEVGGVACSVSIERARTWHAMELCAMANREGATELERLAPTMEYYRLVLGDSLDAIVESCGGEDAPFADVVERAESAIMAASEQAGGAQLKN